MHCPKCRSSQTKKNGFRRGKQSHRCKDCGYQFVEFPTPKGYPPAVSDKLSDREEIPEITEIDELQTFVGKKKNKVWIWTVVNHGKPGILLWAIGDRSSQTFELLWQMIRCWHSFWYVTDGWVVYPSYIEPEDHLVSKTPVVV